jgi:hypothetical protein
MNLKRTFVILYDQAAFTLVALVSLLNMFLLGMLFRGFLL